MKNSGKANATGHGVESCWAPAFIPPVPLLFLILEHISHITSELKIGSQGHDWLNKDRKGNKLGKCNKSQSHLFDQGCYVLRSAEIEGVGIAQANFTLLVSPAPRGEKNFDLVLRRAGDVDRRLFANSLPEDFPFAH